MSTELDGDEETFFQDTEPNLAMIALASTTLQLLRLAAGDDGTYRRWLREAAMTAGGEDMLAMHLLEASAKVLETPHAAFLSEEQLGQALCSQLLGGALN